jgi:hypothetical protein
MFLLYIEPNGTRVNRHSEDQGYTDESPPCALLTPVVLSCRSAVGLPDRARAANTGCNDPKMQDVRPQRQLDGPDHVREEAYLTLFRSCVHCYGRTCALSCAL